MEENNQALFEEEFEMPSRPLETLKRMWNSVEEQHGRLLDGILPGGAVRNR